MADVGERPAPNRGPWIVAGAIVLAAIIVVGAFVLLKDDPCGAWQGDMSEVAAEVDAVGKDDEDDGVSTVEEQDASTALLGVKLDELHRIDEDKPVGCDYPDESVEGWANMARMLQD